MKRIVGSMSCHIYSTEYALHKICLQYADMLSERIIGGVPAQWLDGLHVASLVEIWSSLSQRYVPTSTIRCLVFSSCRPAFVASS